MRLSSVTGEIYRNKVGFMEPLREIGGVEDGMDPKVFPLFQKKEKCADCLKCQMCSESRCQLCRKGSHGSDCAGLSHAFTYGQYVEWKKAMKKTAGKPVIDVSSCSDCESCLSVSPAVFRRNEETGLIEVVEMEEYPADEIQEAVNCCPENCIELENLD
ncbi:ferredoxin [Thermodesulfobacteriota bacterium]